MCFYRRLWFLSFSNNLVKFNENWYLKINILKLFVLVIRISTKDIRNLTPLNIALIKFEMISVITALVIRGGNGCRIYLCVCQHEFRNNESIKYYHVT